ncbi:hypothetical protein MPC4_10498 [Methylocella tundrae]|uniref:Uncharacterized protein n=1 Tax=Methylocella tundrae TaxID=227605 RepID=A0A8B6M329_METTU|nr:hypothetical protein MPC1_3190005 [Methylocella tundrae]VTZ48542.1 hypothetical protein MPC4_10498 [Methylocella tundrae]
MPGLDPGIQPPAPGVWMAGSSPAMTIGRALATLVMPGLDPGTGMTRGGKAINLLNDEGRLCLHHVQQTRRRALHRRDERPLAPRL